MKNLKTILSILFFSLMLGGLSSCRINRHVETERHRGWFFFHHHHPRHQKGAVLIITSESSNNDQRNKEHRR